MLDKRHCQGCRDNFYNGNNGLGVTECWSLKGARLTKRKEVHINQTPPWKQEAKLLPNCYKAPGYVYVRPDQEN